MIWFVVIGIICILIGLALLEKAEGIFNQRNSDLEPFDFSSMLGEWGLYLFGGGAWLGAGVLIFCYAWMRL